MSKIGGFVLLLFLCNTPLTCQTQSVSEAPLTMATEDVLATIVASVKSAQSDAAKAQNDLVKLNSIVKNNFIIIRSRINNNVKDALSNFQEKIDGLGVNISDVTVKDCTMLISTMKSEGEEILTDANSCVSRTVNIIQRELNGMYSSIESILAKINSEQILAEQCVAKYDGTGLPNWDANAVERCVTQVKGRIQFLIEHELPAYLNVDLLYSLYSDGPSLICQDKISTFVEDTDAAFVKIENCVLN